MKPILVTGGTGFVGANVVRELVALGAGVRVLARPGGDRRALDGLPVEIVEGDLLDRASLERAVRGADILYHVAADYRLWARGRNVPAAVVRGVSDDAERGIPAALAAVVSEDGRVRPLRAVTAALTRATALGDLLELRAGTGAALKSVAAALATLARAS